jgi:predicted AAA+ superfamily ATPase
LLRKGYKVFSGKMWNNKEIDFIASKKNIELYIQVTEKIDWDKNSNNYKREIGNLESIRNSHLKVVFSLFDESSITSNGIRIVNVVEWLMEKIPLMEKIE